MSHQALTAQPPMKTDALDRLQEDTLGYFLKETNRANGMVPDNTRPGRTPASRPSEGGGKREKEVTTQKGNNRSKTIALDSSGT